jgi:predicted hydrocarbon binding protein
MKSLRAMTDDAMERGIRAITDLYFYGWVYGVFTTKELVNSFKLKKFEERYKISMDIIGVLGIGDYQTLEFQRAKFAKFKVIKDPFPLQYYPSDKFVCHYIRGMEAGGGTLVHEIIMQNIEFECAAKNNDYCVHTNLNLEELDKVDKKLVSSQIDLDYVLKRQRKILEEAGFNPDDIHV